MMKYIENAYVQHQTSLTPTVEYEIYLHSALYYSMLIHFFLLTWSKLDKSDAG